MFFIIMLVATGLNLGAIRKAEDPIRDTQTSPILYKQKVEEEKDGVKGPVLYHVKNYPKEPFFIDPPYTKEPTVSQKEKSAGAMPSTLDWWEEQPSQEQITPAQEATASEPAASEGQQPLIEKFTSQTDSNAEKKLSKSDDYWW